MNHSTNMFGEYCQSNADYCDKVTKYFTEQLQFMNQRSAEQRYRSPFWNQVYLILKQLAGLEDGYKNATLNGANKYNIVSILL